MAAADLVALLEDSPVGVVRRDIRGRLTFTYEPSWSNAEGAYPISLSMPLAAREHGHSAIDGYLWGLLPDNDLIIKRWAQSFQTPALSAFALMQHVGEECAGAIRFARPERVDAIAKGTRGKVDWLDDHAVAERLRALRQDVSAWRQSTDAGQFSLAGAQPKTALLFDGQRWGVPSGRTPTTHILKPNALDLDGHVQNEHFCLVLARAAGLPTASSSLERFEDQIAIVVERFDRSVTPTDIVRIHQEDICQALGIHPSKKYENEGGPGARAIVDLLRAYSRSAEEDVGTFVDSLIFNWLIGGTEAHAKNYALLIGAEGRVRLAPLYDIASILPYAGKQLRKAKLAMKIGGKYRLTEIGPYQWDKLARELTLAPDQVRASVVRLSQTMPDLVEDVHRKERPRGLSHPVVKRLRGALIERARQISGK